MNRSYIKIILKVQKLTEFLAQRTSINLFHRLRPYFSGDNGHPDESVIDRPRNPDSSAEFHKKYFNYLNVGDRTRGNENDSSSEMIHLSLESI